MNKKYEILNSRTSDDCTVFYVLYIVLIFVIIFIIYKIIYYLTNANNISDSNTNQPDTSPTDLNAYQNKLIVNDNLENFETNNLDTNVDSEHNNHINYKNLSSQEIVSDLINKNKELLNIKNSIENKLHTQSKAIYISQNYDKVDSSSFDDEMIFLLYDFSNTKFPNIDFKNKKLIETQSELEGILSEAKLMKNFYKPGEIVEANSTFHIDKNQICHRHDGKPIKPTAEFLQKYPDCMVCSVESEKDIYDSNAWKNTHTNINTVCLYNPTAETNSGIPNMEECQKFCSINQHHDFIKNDKLN